MDEEGLSNGLGTAAYPFLPISCHCAMLPSTIQKLAGVACISANHPVNRYSLLDVGSGRDDQP